MLYRLRFIFTAEIFGDWQLFGGLAAQLSHFPIVLHLPTVGTMAVSLPRGRIVGSFSAEKSRARDEGSSQPLPADGNEFPEMPSAEQ